jgi:hypothetical protein
LPKDWYFRITEHIFVVKKKRIPTYLPTSKIVGRVRGNRNIFNCGPCDGKSSHCLWQGELKKEINLENKWSDSLQSFF